MAVRIRIWRKQFSVWLRMEKSDGQSFTVELAYEEAMEMRHRLDRVHSRMMQAGRRPRTRKVS